MNEREELYALLRELYPDKAEKIIAWIEEVNPR